MLAKIVCKQILLERQKNGLWDGKQNTIFIEQG